MHTSIEPVKALQELWVTSQGPATIANLGPGFDALGLALKNVDNTSYFGDTVNARRRPDWSDIRLTRIDGCQGLPMDDSNVAVAAAKKLFELTGTSMGVEMTLRKCRGIGTGTGGSAASAVAGLLAANGLLDKPLAKDDPRMLQAALYAEAVAIRKPQGHADNVWPALLGGLVYIKDAQALDCRRFDIEDDLIFVVITPNIVVETAKAREALLRAPYDISELVRLSSKEILHYLHKDDPDDYQSAFREDITKALKEGGNEQVVRTYLTGSYNLIKGLVGKRVDCLREALFSDLIVTPIRSMFIPGYTYAHAKAMDAGAIGFSISGSGPSVFAVARSKREASVIGKEVKDVFASAGIDADFIIAQADNDGGSVVTTELRELAQ